MNAATLEPVSCGISRDGALRLIAATGRDLQDLLQAAAEVRQRWAIRTEFRLWGLEEWSWPVADLEQEVRAGAVHVRLTSQVDVARGRPALPACPGCAAPAEMLVRSRGTVVCARCA